MSAPLSSVLRFAHEAMTTLFEIFIPGPDPTYAGQAAREAFREIDRLEARFNRFDPGSEISRINRLLPGEETVVGIETFECLALAEAVRLETGQAFDVNARAAAPDAVPESREAVPAPAAFELLGGTGSCLVRRLEEGRPGHGPLDLDLGGIGKGYALDRAGQLLLTWGSRTFSFTGGRARFWPWARPFPRPGRSRAANPPNGRDGRSGSEPGGPEPPSASFFPAGPSADREPRSRAGTFSIPGRGGRPGEISPLGPRPRRPRCPTPFPPPFSS